jgi:hypothetical protein
MDIVKRLREINALCETLFTDQSHTLVEAANEIERLREALKHMLRWHDQLSPADIAKAEAALKKDE